MKYLSLLVTILISSVQVSAAENNEYEIATFAGGCFWCLESDMDKVEGVIKTISGYTGGHLKNPSYEEVSAGGTGHAESVQVTFDPRRVSYEQLLKKFWVNIDPTVKDQQFCDHGSQYRSVIFYHNEAQRVAAEKSFAEIKKNKPFKGEIYTELLPASTFYSAETYHQDYYQKNPVRYNYYRFACGRDKRLEQLWGTKH